MGPNPNTFQGIPETWSKEYQTVHDKVPVYPVISNYRLAAGLQVGDTVNRSYPSTLRARTMGADGSYATKAIVDTNEQLLVDKAYEASFYVKSLDEIQNSLPVRQGYANRAMVAIFQQVDADILGLYDQFTYTVDDGDIGGTTGAGIASTPTNVKSVFFKAKNKLQKKGQQMMNNNSGFSGFKSKDDQNAMGVAVISPDVYTDLLTAVGEKDTVFGDTVSKAGHAGMYAGFNMFTSNQLAWSGKLLIGTQPSNNETVIINGVTWTFKTTLGTTAGNVLIGASATTAIANLVLAINNGSAAAAGAVDSTNVYVELSEANRDLVATERITATAVTGGLTVKFTGIGYAVVSETFSAAADVWTPTLQVQHCLFGVANAIDVVIQKTPSLEMNPVSGKIGKDFVTWVACGYKVFNEGKLMMVDVWIRTDSYL